MKSMIAAALVAAFALAGCASQRASSLQGKIAAACPVVQVAVVDVQALGSSLSADDQKKVADLAPVIAQVCAGNATIDTASLAALVQTGLPPLIADVNATSLPADKKARVVTALALAQIALTSVVQRHTPAHGQRRACVAMSAFLTQLSVRGEDQRDIGKWILNEPLVYQSDVARRTITVPKDFSTDFASVPRWLPLAFAWLGGHGDSAATIHDWLYTEKPVSRRMADMVLREALRASYVARWRIPLFHWGVRLFGWTHWT